MNTSKIHLHVEQFSLKINWRLAERHLSTKAVKKDPHGSQEGKRIDQVRTCALGGDTEEKGITQAQRSSLGSEQFKSHTGHPCPGV